MREFLKVLSPGLLTTVQDLGRPGYQRYGFSPNGALDSYSLRLGNLLVGNGPGAAGLEITLAGPVLEVLGEGVVAVSGADLSPSLNGEPIPMWEAAVVTRGDRLSFGSPVSGSRAYLTVAGGIDVPPVMGSRSTDMRGRIGGIEGRALKAGDIIPAGSLAAEPGELRGRRVRAEAIPRFPEELEVRVILGPQDDRFTAGAVRKFLASTYRVSERSDRMGLRLEGEALEHIAGADIISEGNPAGGVQVPKDGKPIILLASRQTIGGYAKIAVVISADLDRVGQLKPGDRVRFRAVDLEEAHRALREREALLKEESIIRGGGPGRVLVLRLGGREYRVEVSEMGEGNEA